MGMRRLMPGLTLTVGVYFAEHEAVVTTSGHFHTVIGGTSCARNGDESDHCSHNDSVERDDDMDVDPQIVREIAAVPPSSHNLPSWTAAAVPLADAPHGTSSNLTIPVLQFSQLQSPEPVKRLTSRRVSEDIEANASPRSTASSSSCFSTSPVSPFVKVFPVALPPAAVVGQPSFP